jgi:nicotinate dehydrogenase subunit A
MTVQIRRVSHAAIVGESERSPFMPSFSLHVNGRMLHVDVDDPDMPLLYTLRDILKLKGPRFGCGLAQSGACTVHIDGEPTRSCVRPLSGVGAGKIVTLEGLGTPEQPHPLQQAFIDEQAVQCGYCINGMIMQSAALLRQKPHPAVDDIKQALANNLCRCGTHLRIIRAVQRAAHA